MSEYLIQDTTLTDIADAIREKTGKTDTMTPLEMPGEIAAIQGGGGGGASVSPKEVNFIDYDGTVLYAYTVSEAAALTELPPLPSHAGLICQGWNWSLEDIKALGRSVVVGAMYITDDGKTRLYITIPSNSMAGRPPARSDVPLYISQTVANGVTIDWGDGSPAETLDGTGNVNTTHHYDEAGDYVITLEPGEGCELGLGADSSSYCVMGSTGNNGRVYCNMLQKVEIGRGVTGIGSYAFQRCYSLLSITIPDGVTSIGDYTFQYCYSLSSITIPDGTTFTTGCFSFCCSIKYVSIANGIVRLAGNLFYNGYGLNFVTIPDSITEINTSAFIYCQSLQSIIVPHSVTKIERTAFQYCSGLSELYVKPVSPPKMENANALGGLLDDCIIYVPAGSLEAYQTATNWSAYADQMQEEPS